MIEALLATDWQAKVIMCLFALAIIFAIAGRIMAYRYHKRTKIIKLEKTCGKMGLTDLEKAYWQAKG